jgi:hypothetical protein
MNFVEKLFMVWYSFSNDYNSRPGDTQLLVRLRQENYKLETSVENLVRPPSWKSKVPTFTCL